MNKYELAVVVSAKLEDDERAAAIEKVKNMITKHGGTITNVDEWGKKRLAYSSFSLMARQPFRQRSSQGSVSWRTLSDICALDRTRNRMRACIMGDRGQGVQWRTFIYE